MNKRIYQAADRTDNETISTNSDQYLPIKFLPEVCKGFIDVFCGTVPESYAGTALLKF